MELTEFIPQFKTGELEEQSAIRVTYNYGVAYEEYIYGEKDGWIEWRLRDKDGNEQDHAVFNKPGEKIKYDRGAICRLDQTSSIG